MIRLAGELDRYTAPVFRSRLDYIERPCVIDVRELKFVDSDGIGELTALASRAGYIRLVNSPRQLNQLVKVLGVGDELEVSAAT